MKKFSQVLFLALSFGVGSAVFAHTIWIEPKDDQLVIRFAEPGENFETSPGFLDSLSVPEAFITVTNSPHAVSVTKTNDGFLLAKSSTTNVACTETTFTVRGGRKPIFYARWQALTVQSKPMLTLDLLPTGKPGEVQILFRGKPLAATKATLRGPGDKEDELTSDAEGLLHFSAEKSGQYLLTVPHYRESIPGFYRGTAFTETSHNTALTWRQP